VTAKQIKQLNDDHDYSAADHQHSEKHYATVAIHSIIVGRSVVVLYRFSEVVSVRVLHLRIMVITLMVLRVSRRDLLWVEHVFRVAVQ